MKKEIVEKFLNNECTTEEARRVLNWFRTEEGKRYLKKRLDKDSKLLQDERLRHLVPNVDTGKMWDIIREETTYSRHQTSGRHQTSFSFWHAAAAVLIIATTSLFYFMNQDSFGLQGQEAQPIHYVTSQDQHKKLTLGDGTEIRLNSNSELWISKEFGRQKREVKLRGEAFFNVPHNEEKPFLIYTGQATIKDLGTAFNVKAIPGKQNVQVAVTEGEVSVWADEQSESESQQLKKGQYGYLDLVTKKTEVDEFGIANYLSWMNGEFKFDNAPLNKVGEQLNRIYGVTFSYSEPSLQTRQLTTDFQCDSLSKVLDVIALTLDISYKKQQENIVWISTDNSNK